MKASTPSTVQLTRPTTPTDQEKKKPSPQGPSTSPAVKPSKTPAQQVPPSKPTQQLPTKDQAKPKVNPPSTAAQPPPPAKKTTSSTATAITKNPAAKSQQLGTHSAQTANPSASHKFDLKPGYIFQAKSGRRYKARGKIGEGGMGAVYEAEETVTKARYAVKCEKKDKGCRLHIAMEKQVMKACAESPHITEHIDSGKTENFAWIAMELVGQTLGDLRRHVPNRSFSTATTLKIGSQMVEGLQQLHSKGFVHRDLKPYNLAIGLNAKSNTIFLLDYGIARGFKDSKGKIHLPRKNVKFQGTWDYAPLALHLQEEYGPKDDLESMFYVLADMHVGRLPWSELDGDQAITRSKEQHRKDFAAIFANSELSAMLLPCWNYTTRLSYESTVDYTFYKAHLSAALQLLDARDAKFDWEVNMIVD